MDYAFYLNKFHLAVAKVSKEKFEIEGLEFSVDIVLESAALKIYKPEWSGNPQSPLDAAGRIFFSIWITDETIQEGRMYYNIHALKLRTLKSYMISSRNFAQDFRNEFLKSQEDWPNVSVKYGPLTLMQGWVNLKTEDIQENVYELVQNFFKISFIIDSVLEKYKKDRI
ncbi:hypothetical protein [Chryseobacterium sp. JV558]|uniref:hypothetical protein n=1 Tax=Chryseobacterium sp. JV558 TaxID=2663236 RepID=UPI00299E188E|nr:hypothetical protein [Chryseobacterium sp. JV558]MDW9382967.1 hypothetical protein [Chryseobacterium sp. JV558]